MSTALTAVPDDLPDEAPIAGLTLLQSRFVRAFVSSAGGNATEAARLAGYAPEFASRRAFDLTRNPAVREAIQSEMLAAIGDAAPGALASMAHLSRHAKSEMVRQVAAKDLLDRAGFRPPDRLMVAHGGSIDVDIKLGD